MGGMHGLGPFAWWMHHWYLPEGMQPSVLGGGIQGTGHGASRAAGPVREAQARVLLQVRRLERQGTHLCKSI